MQFSDQNYKSQLNLIMFFFQVPPFIRVDVLKLKKKDGERFNNDY